FPLAFDPQKPIFIKIERAVFSGDVSSDGETVKNARLSGTVSALEFASHLEAMADAINAKVLDAAVEYGEGAPIACSSDAECQPPGACTETDGQDNNTGVCIDSSSPLVEALALTDGAGNGNGNGIVEVTFNEGSKAFDTNELTIAFDLDGQGLPIGGL